MNHRTLRLALVGGGMFGRDVVMRCVADVQRCGLAPYLGSAGLDTFARQVAPLRFRLVAVGTRTAESAQRLVQTYRQWIGADPEGGRSDSDQTAYCVRGSCGEADGGSGSGGEVDGGHGPVAYHGPAPWEAILAEQRPDILLVATPDHLHTAPILAAIAAGVHVVAEKPLALTVAEAEQIAEAARRAGVVVAVDMHKRYDACLRSAFVDLVPRLGELLYARAVLEEPLEVATQTFAWAERSNPFSYVGVHWTDLFAAYLGVRPVSLHAVGQKRLLAGWRDERHPAGIDTFDAMQVAVQYDSGLSVQYVNAWINPAEFEGPVNQELEIVGTRGRLFVDQQDRGMRSCITGAGSRTHNPHFAAEVPRAAGVKVGDATVDGTTEPGTVSPDRRCVDASHPRDAQSRTLCVRKAAATPPAATFVGYGKDSLIAGLTAAARVAGGRATVDQVAGTYPDAASAVGLVAILEAAERVARANHDRLTRGRGATVTAVFAGHGYRLTGDEA